MTRRSSINIIINIILSLLILCVNQALAAPKPAPLVIWEKSAQHVSIGSKTVPIEYHLTHPCFIIEKYSIFLSSIQPAAQPAVAQPVLVQHHVPSGLDQQKQQHVPPAPEQQPVIHTIPIGQHQPPSVPEHQQQPSEQSLDGKSPEIPFNPFKIPHEERIKRQHPNNLVQIDNGHQVAINHCVNIYRTQTLPLLNEFNNII